MTEAVLGIGSNIDPEHHVPWTLKELDKATNLISVAPIYRTAPIDRPDQSDYWNTLARIDWPGSPTDLSSLCSTLEQAAGRIRTSDRFSARTLDVDVLMWDGRPVDDDAADELADRPWNAWGLHRMGMAEAPDSPEPNLAA